MTEKDTLTTLAERVEQASGPDRVLEAEIYRGLAGLPIYGVLTPQGEVADRVPHFTSSLDAAMTLVPEGLDFGCGSKDATGKAWAWVGVFNGWDEIANAATPALALAAAALKCRAYLLNASEQEVVRG